MTKHKIGIRKMEAAMQRRLDRGAAKMRRKHERHSGILTTRKCSIYSEFGRHHYATEYDGTVACLDCCRKPTRWFEQS